MTVPSTATTTATDLTEIEDYLLMIADHGTASHVARLVRNYRHLGRQQALERDIARSAKQELTWYIDQGGCYVIHARLDPELGARVTRAIDLAAENVSAQTSRRLACDCGVVHWLENSKGNALNIGRRSRTIPPALQRRDGGCTFPGCTAHQYVDAHHIRHWADGGETKMDNLVQLCRHHHRLVHEGGYSVVFSGRDQVQVRTQEGNLVSAGPDTRFRGIADPIAGRSRRPSRRAEGSPHSAPAR